MEHGSSCQKGKIEYKEGEPSKDCNENIIWFKKMELAVFVGGDQIGWIAKVKSDLKY